MSMNFFASQEGRPDGNEGKTKKALIVLFLFFGVFLIFFSFRQLKNNIYSPFNFAVGDATDLNEAESDLASKYKLQDMDTDGDGLSDYDEIYIYDTSPYLADTDSDGVSDYDEIALNTDPLCAEGQDCYGLEDNFLVEPDEVIPADEVNTELVVEKSEELSVIEDIMSGEIDASILRKLLLDNGFVEEELEQISDEDLKQVYFDIVTEQLANKE